MIISNELKYIFIHVPKTGGTSIVKFLCNYDEFKYTLCGFWDGFYKLNKSKYPKVTTDLYIHASIDEVGSYLKKHGEDHKEYFKFAFIRNPWDLMVSSYEYYRQYMIKGVNLPAIEKQKVKEALDGDFNDWCIKYAEGVQLYLHNRVFSGDKLGVNHLGKMEDMRQELKFIFWRIAPHIDMDAIDLPHLNSTKRREYQEYYNDATKDFVAAVFGEIIKLGRYKYQ